LLGSSLTVLSQWGISYNFKDSLFQKKYSQYFWAVIIELVSGFDVEKDKLALNPVSDILTVIVLITGIIIFAIFTGQIVSMFIHVRQRHNHLPEKPPHFKFKRPIVICGINHKLHAIIRGLRGNHLAKGREIVVVGQESDTVQKGEKEYYEDTWYVKGDQADRSILANALGGKESAAIILWEKNKCPDINDRYADSKALETALAIEGYRQNTHTLLELKDESNIPHLEYTKINEWISVKEYGIKLTAQAALQEGMGKIYHHLLGACQKENENNQIYFTQFPLPPGIEGCSYAQIREKLTTIGKLDVTLVGFSRFLPLEDREGMELKRNDSPYILQLNPSRGRCRDCGKLTGNKDRWGRVKSHCGACRDKRAEKGQGIKIHWLFPVDTLLNPADRLVYLARAPITLDSLKKYLVESKIV